MRAFRIGGMTCGHCVRAVTEAVQGLDPAASVAVDLDAGRMTVDKATASDDQIAEAIIAEGYTAERIAP